MIISKLAPLVAGCHWTAASMYCHSMPFTWSPVAHADRYDLFVWPSNRARPASPNLLNIQGFNTSKYLQYAQSYHWQLRAKNACAEKWSDTLTFQSAVLPDLTLTSLMAPTTSDYGQTIAARWVVENVGLAGTGVETWVDRVWLCTRSWGAPIPCSARSAILVTSTPAIPTPRIEVFTCPRRVRRVLFAGGNRVVRYFAGI